MSLIASDLTQMSSAAASTSADAPGDALPSAINHIAALPTELQLELLKWTGVCSPRALWALSSTNRELRLLSESLRWKVSFAAFATRSAG